MSLDHLLLVSALIPLLIALLVPRCRHTWTMVSDREFPSPAEVLKLTGCTLAGRETHMDWCRRGYAAVLKCDRCGEVRVYKIGRCD